MIIKIIIYFYDYSVLSAARYRVTAATTFRESLFSGHTPDVIVELKACVQDGGGLGVRRHHGTFVDGHVEGTAVVFVSCHLQVLHDKG